jgi:exodeoxyribonuclease-5
VLRAKGVPATTIHRILYTPVYDPEFEKVAAWLTGEGRPARRGQLTDQQLDRAKVAYEQHGSVPAALAAAGLRGSDFITGWKRREEPLDMGFVDEASMLDDRALEDLQEIFPTLLIFGDPAQLPPVQGQGTGAAMIFEKLPPAQVRTLTRVHRQEADSPILDLAQALRTRARVRRLRGHGARGRGPRPARAGLGARGQRPHGSLARCSCGATPRGSSSSTPSAPPMPRPRPSSCPASR